MRPCRCCESSEDALVTHANRPGLSAIEYRLGTYGIFRQAILERLSSTPELQSLRSRDSDDYAITVVELWAAVADVLTFYSERIANESFLRTATLRDSVLRLTRLLDYQLAPGIAATAVLAFTLERGTRAIIPARTRVQSVPGEGEKAQKYETTEDLAADAALNRLRLVGCPMPAEPLAHGSSFAIAAPDAEAVANVGALKPGDRLALYAPEGFEILTVDAVESVEDLLIVRWKQPIGGAGFEKAAGANATGYGLRRLGRTLRVFGYDAPPHPVVAALKTPGDQSTAYLIRAVTDYWLRPGQVARQGLPLDARYPDLKPGAELLLVAPSRATVLTAPATVDRVEETWARRPTSVAGTDAMSGTVTALHDDGHCDDGLSDALVTVSERMFNQSQGGQVPSGRNNIRLLTIYELLGQPLRLWPCQDDRNIVASDTVYVPGRRAGWSSIEVARTIQKGAYCPGSVLDLADLPRGRRVIAVDEAGSTPVQATVIDARLVGLDLELGPTETDPETVEQIGFGPDQTTPITVLVSAPISADRAKSLTLGPSSELSVAIGQSPRQTISLGGALAGQHRLGEVADALQAAIRAARPGSAAFANAIVWTYAEGPSDTDRSALLIAAGVPGEAIEFGPSDRDATTVVTLGLDQEHARYLDGVVSGPQAPLEGRRVQGTIRVRVGLTVMDKPLDFVVGGKAEWEALSEFAQVLEWNDRILLAPPMPRYEPRSYLRFRLALEASLALDASTAGLLANVATASHGETIRDEIVGDGDASQAFQRFALRKSPVTYVPAAVPGGKETSLQLFVNGVEWQEVPTLYGAERTAEVFTTRLGDDCIQTVQFGDGVTGARAPSGRANLVATYRQGSGLAGRVRARTLTTLLDRPTGVKAVVNPGPAEGGADPEAIDRARVTAPGSVRTLGRAISLRDFEDATLLAGEVAKARAGWVWAKRRRIVHLTVAGQGGTTFPDSKLAELMAAISAARDPNHELLVSNYQPVPIVVSATVTVDDRYVRDQVLADARAALVDALSFDRRSFGETIDLSGIYAVLQHVAGVRSVDIDRLDLKSPDAGFRSAHGLDPAKGSLQPRLPMLPARPDGSPTGVAGAEIAVVEVPPLDLTLAARGGIAL
jgi:hypothetical protein